jgi:aspartyl-tRNA(Asn)/glutamyl-tRNA(Gln) amidotransferase subunit A
MSADHEAIRRLGVVQIAEAVRAGSLRAIDVAEASLAAIAADNERLGAYLHVAGEGVRAAAKSLDERVARGETLGPLAGVPIGLKDALTTIDMPTTAGSRMLVGAAKHGASARPWQPPYDATVVAKLRAADALLPGKCNLDELAMGSSTENSAFFPSKNPVDDTRTPGGSSGGSAVTVAARMTPASLGSDTGGSIRQPAAFTGVVGVKPTYGRVSRYGLVAFASSLDQVGPFASDVAGAARVLGVIAGHDPKDATSLDEAVPAFEAACGEGVRGIRIGIPAEYFGAGVDGAVEASVQAAIAGLVAAGATVVPVSLPHTRFAVATYYVLAMAEASTNLSRFDGVRFGLRRDGETGRRGDLATMYEATRGEGFGPEVKRRILLGTYVLSAGYYDAYYRKAQRVRTLIRRDFEAAFAEVDILAAPAAPTPAFRLGERRDDPLAMYLSDALTLPASLAGIPALSVPVGRTPATAEAPALPVGLQLIARSHDERTLFRVAAEVERQLQASGT